ncbi:MAG: amylo-alpha-1,6-glucosidase [Bacteroidota bacterium]|nr:amylo-alpha-1,6-glucosidase [Bacteroidota bacterium]
MKKHIILFILLLTHIVNGGEIPLVEQIAIEVKKMSREFSFTNKESAFYYGETNDRNKSSWQGLNVMAREFLEDYLIIACDLQMDKKNTASTLVYPHQLFRKYKNGASEMVTLLDSVPVLLIDVNLPNASLVNIFPLLSDFKRQTDYEIDFVDNVLLIARKNHLKRTVKEDYPVWLGITLNTQLNRIADEYKIEKDYSPAGVVTSGQQISFKLVIGVGDSKKGTIELLKHSLLNSDLLIEKRKERMEKLLRETRIKTQNERFDRALMWAKISMDALIMNQVTKGIFAGLPWFNNYWGRDSFISLPGTSLVTGNFREARKILTSFAAFQEKDKTNSNYGRIPNIITTTHKSYNTADGTPRFVIAALDYYRYSGDKNFVKEIFPVIERSIEGTLKYHSDKNIFLLHGDEETWMDAVGPDGAWTPRGDRANDIQALWYQQLHAGAEFAKLLKKNKLANKWVKLAEELKNNFNQVFVSPENNAVYDHLNADGTADPKHRSNQIFCAPILNDETRANVLANVVTNLTYVYGVGSLNQFDEQFHPYHQNLPYYVKDAAYHQGTVWTWLSGKVVSELCRFEKQEKAFQLTGNLVHQIMNRGAVGTISELLDAHPRQGAIEPDVSGTFTQAWSLAEFIRNIYQDFIGVKFDFKDNRIVNITPRLPEKLGSIEAMIKFGDESFVLSVAKRERYSVQISSVNTKKPITINLEQRMTSNEVAKIKSVIHPNSDFIATVDEAGQTLVKINPETTRPTIDILYQPIPYENIFNEMEFAQPLMLDEYPVMRAPQYSLLNNSEIKKSNSSTKNLIDIDDAVGDDNGNGNYTYPLNPNFHKGILDIVNFKVSYDNDNVYFKLRFKKLVDPGWHPEYGFQLTYAAIAIDQDGITNSGKMDVGMNSQFKLEPALAFEKIIYVGGGIRVDNSDGKILAQYIPVDNDVLNPLGDISTGTIEFSIPHKYIGIPDEKWRFTVLIGGQNDHGGAGIGDFRGVEAKAGEWSGGGKTDPKLPNVYDVLKSY